jgi:lysozyme
MKTSVDAAMRILEPLLLRFEGLRTKAYICPAGKITIGVGHTGPEIRLGDEWSRDRCIVVMRMDAERFISGALTLCPTLADKPHALAAIADFSFNLGLGRLRASTLRRKLNSGDTNGAANELRKWVMGGGRKLPGLVLRRETERALLLKSDKIAT